MTHRSDNTAQIRTAEEILNSISPNSPDFHSTDDVLRAMEQYAAQFKQNPAPQTPEEWSKAVKKKAEQHCEYLKGIPVDAFGKAASKNAFLSGAEWARVYFEYYQNQLNTAFPSESINKRFRLAHDAIHDPSATEVKTGLGNHPVKRTKDGRRMVIIGHFTVVEQGKTKNTHYSKRARAGEKLSWVIPHEQHMPWQLIEGTSVDTIAQEWQEKLRLSIGDADIRARVQALIQEFIVNPMQDHILFHEHRLTYLHQQVDREKEWSRRLEKDVEWLQKQIPWRRMDEELPVLMQYVLVSYNGRTKKGYDFVTWTEESKKNHLSELIITHWVPLTKPQERYLKSYSLGL